MGAKLHHVAINTENFENSLHFWEQVFGMTISRTTGEAPGRKAWFHEGIQINEIWEPLPEGQIVDHVAICVDNTEEAAGKLKAYGAEMVSGKANWWKLSNGIAIELME